MGLIFSGIAAVGLVVLFYVWMEASTYPGIFGSAIADVVIIGVGIVVVPIASLVVFFVGRGYGHRRRMNLLMASLTEEGDRDGG